MKSDTDDDQPLPFRARMDLQSYRITSQNELGYVVKDPVRLKYYRLEPVQAAVLEMLQKPRSLEQLKSEAQRQFPSIHIESRDLQKLVQDLHSKGLTLCERVGQSLSLRNRHREQIRKAITSFFMNPMFVRFPGWDPNAALSLANTCFGWIFSRAAVFFVAAFVAFSVFFGLSHADEIWRRLPGFEQFFAWPNLIYLWLTIAVTKLVHEFGHGIACKRFGGECRQMGLVLIVFSPTLYCDTSDSWTFQNKWHRIYVAAAGVYFEVIMAAIAVLAWWYLREGLLQNICLNVFFISCFATLVVNLNPLMRFDGYYILSDFLEIPNMQQKAQQSMQHQIAKQCLGIELPPNPFLPRNGIGLFASYAVVGSTYRLLIMFGIASFLFTMLKPYRLEVIGLLLATVMISLRIFKIGKSWHQILSMPRTRPIAKTRLITACVVAIALISFAIMIPFPWYLDAPCYVQVRQGRDVFTTMEGSVQSVTASAGEYVQKDDLLLRLENEPLRDEAIVLETQLAAIIAEQNAARAREDFATFASSQQRQASLRRELSEVQRRIEKLSIYAPVSGWVVSAPRRPRISSTKINEPLPLWSGTPLNPKNLGAFLPVQTQVCTIAGQPNFDAVLLVRQDDYQHISVGSQVRIAFEHLPGHVVTTRVEKESSRTIEYCPASLSNKFGGPIATIQMPDGRERLLESLIPFSVKLPDSESQLLRHELRGAARIVIADYSIAGWIKRKALSTLRFRM